MLNSCTLLQVGFFSKCGFSDDPILNARFRKLLTGGWHDHRQTVTMCYELPEQLATCMKPSERRVYSTLEHIDSQVCIPLLSQSAAPLERWFGGSR